MTHSIFTLDPNYSTTRLVSTIKPQIEEHPEAKFKTHLFLPEGEGRQGEGGLRTKGYFKHSYEVIDGQWYITDNFGVSEEDAQRIPVDEEQVPDDLLEYVREIVDCAEGDAQKRSNASVYKEYIKLPLISLITIVYNGEKHLQEAVDSVLSQTYPNIEYIVVDGQSKDATLNIIYNHDSSIDYWISESDKGIYGAMNKGISLSHGAAVGLVNADDVIYPDLVKNVAKYLSADQEAGFTCAPVDLAQEDGVVFGKVRPLSNEEIKSRIYREMPFPHQGIYVRHRIYKSFGMFDERYRLRADYDFLLRLLENNVPYVRLESSVGFFRSGGQSGGFATFIETRQLLRDHGVPNKYIEQAFFSSLFKLVLRYALPKAFYTKLKRLRKHSSSEWF